MQENRCEKIVVVNMKPTVCNGLLFKGEIIKGKIEVKCQKCKGITVIKGKEDTNTLVIAEIG